MADFTTTTNLSLKKPAIGGSSDKWGEYINANLDTIDIEIQTLKTASSSRTLESLSNVLNLTPTTGQVLQYGIASWNATTLSIPEDVEDLSNVTVTSPSDGQVLAWSNSNSRWENQTPGAATIPNGSITSAKLSTSLQGQLNLILQTTGTPTDDQILRYNATTTNWEFQDLPGGTISALSDTDVSAISNKDVLVYNSTSGDWVSRPLAIADVTGLQTELDAKLESSDLSVSSLTDTTITTTADNSVLVYDASDSKWKNEGPSTARTSLGLGTLATQNTITESQISDLGSYITASSTDTLTNKSGNISQWTNDSGYLTAETNDLTASVTWTNVPDANITQSSVTQHQAALTITESQISDLQSYLTAETNDLGSAVTGTLGVANGGTGLTAIGTANQVLAVNAGATALEFQTLATGGTVTSVAVSGTDGIEIDSGSPITTSGTIALGINAATLSSHLSLGTAATTASTDYATAAQGSTADSAVQPGDNANTLGSGAATDGYVLTADGAGGAAWEAVSAGGGTDVTLAGSIDYLTISGQEITLHAINLTTDVTGTLPIATGGTGATTASAARIALGLEIGTDVQSYDADTTKNDVSNTFSANQIISVESASDALRITQAGAGNALVVEDTTNPDSTPFVINAVGQVGIGTDSPTEKLDVTGNINASGTLTLGTALAVAEGGTGVTALSSLDAADLGSSTATDGYVLTADGSGGAAWEAVSGGGGGTTAYLEHSSTISDSFTVTSGTNRMYIGGTTFSGTITVAGRLAIVAGPANFTGTINITGTLATV